MYPNHSSHFDYRSVSASDNATQHLGNQYNFYNINIITSDPGNVPLFDLAKLQPTYSFDTSNVPEARISYPNPEPQPSSSPSSSRPPQTSIQPERNPPSGEIISKEQSETKQLVRLNIQTQGRVRDSSGGDNDRLDPRYKRRTPDFFKPGRVFKILWALPSDEEDEAGAFETGTFMAIRWFVVVKAGSSSSTCVPIVTYGGQGVAKPGVTKSDHAIAYTYTAFIYEDRSEGPQRNERPMRRPIRILPDERGDKMDPMARINYSRIYNVEHNVKAMAFGHVHKDSEQDLVYGFRAVWDVDED